MVLLWCESEGMVGRTAPQREYARLRKVCEACRTFNPRESRLAHFAGASLPKTSPFAKQGDEGRRFRLGPFAQMHVLHRM